MREHMVWREDGTWLESDCDLAGGRRWSYCGKISLPSVQEFCRLRHIRLTIRDKRGRVVTRFDLAKAREANVT